MIVYNTGKNTQLTAECRTADTFASRFRGLMGRKSLEKGCGLLITPCNSIHMFFMKFPIDAVFLAKDGTVVHICKGIKPWRVSKIITKAHSVLELPAGTAETSLTCIGDKIAFL